MHEQMPEKIGKFIETECLKVARGQLGCGHLQAVRIGRTKPAGSGPNWEVLCFTPTLPKIAHGLVMEAIAPLRDKYGLAAS
jgi:hypothetical protein